MTEASASGNAAAAGHKLRGKKGTITMYYEINEEAARRGHEAYSMFDKARRRRYAFTLQEDFKFP